jgi:LuxR family maltose regulon positive regulatory protein
LVGLLETVATRRIDSQLEAYIQELVNAFTPLPERRISTSGSEEGTLIEPLSERELEVLYLLPSSLSSTEMANELSISVNTLRSHLKNIYTKLDAHSRYEAIARAKESGLL